MRIRRFDIDPGCAEPLGRSLESLGYVKRERVYFRGGAFLEEEIEIGPNAAEYRFLPRGAPLVLLVVVLAVVWLALLAFFWSLAIQALEAWRAASPMWILLTSVIVAVFTYAPVTWIYAWVTRRSSSREREAIDAIDAIDPTRQA